VRDLNRRKKQTATIKPKPSEANQLKPQFKALTAIKPEATNPGTQNIVALCTELKVLAKSRTTEGTRNISKR